MSFERVRGKLVTSLVLCVTLASAASWVEADDAGYGTISGQLVLEGDIPAPELLFAEGATVTADGRQIKDALCAAEDYYKDDLIIDPETKGIANIFVYISARKAKKLKIHPDLKQSKEKSVVFDQKGCRFIPKALFARTDQTIFVKSADDCLHNTNAIFLRNTGFNQTIAPNDRKGLEVRLNQSERLPMPVRCDLHSWMTARWLILDHPYAAISDKEGRFTIPKLPVGEHEFIVYHERSGWINKKFKVSVKSGKNELPVVQVPLEKFKK